MEVAQVMVDDTPQNPLSEPNVFSLDELMSRDPLSLRKSPRFIAEQIAQLRKQREKWLIDEASGKKTRGKRAKKIEEEPSQ